jgi:hypothetical protein
MDNNDHNIRPPDPVKMDRLINDDTNDLINPILDNKIDYDLNTVLEFSKNEFNNAQEQEEQKAIELICSQTKEEQDKERKNKFDNIKVQLNKIILFDRNNLNYYELVLSVIEMFELGLINEYKTNETEYTNIFQILKTIRLPTKEIENLKKVILCE